jgi:hypothetical protein
VIGKVIRGTHAGRLLHYLYGPGKANEHTDPHLIAGFSDPAGLEPERRPNGSPDLRRLAELLAQPLAALSGPGYDKPIWHCAVRAAPDDRILTDAEWAQVAAEIMDRTGLAPAGDAQAVRWVAVRHAPDHVHIVATLACQDGTRPKTWNDYYRVREACLDAEQRLGLTATAPADRTAARRPSRAETEQAARRGWDEPPRTRLRREVHGAAAGASTEKEFFARLTGAGVLIRTRHSTVDPGAVTGYAVGLPGHVAKDGGTIWYGGGKLAADLTLPKLRTRWATPTTQDTSPAGPHLPATGARALLRGIVTSAAEQAGDESAFLDQLRTSGVLVRFRFSELNPSQVTGYAVALPGHIAKDGQPVWFGGGRLAPELSLPRLCNHWNTGDPAGTGPHHKWAGQERDAIFEHVARQTAAAAEHVRRAALGEPALAADAAYAVADALHVAARVTRHQALRHAADAYDRAARAPYGRIPGHTRHGNQLRAAARLLALTRPATGDTTILAGSLITQLASLVIAVADLRQAQQHATQVAAARAAAERLHAISPTTRPIAPHPGQAPTHPVSRSTAAVVAGRDHPAPSTARPTGRPVPSPARPGPARRSQPRRRAGPGR